MFQMQQLLLRAKDKEAAAAMLERLVAPYRNMMETHVVLAQSALARGAKATPVREARAALQIKPDSEIAVLTLAQVSEDESRRPRCWPTSWPPIRTRAKCAWPMRACWSTPSSTRPRARIPGARQGPAGQSGTLYALGILSMQMNDNKGAEGYFTRFVDVMDKTPDDERDPSKAVLILSQLAEERGDIKAALGWLDRLETEGDPKIQFGAELRRAQLTRQAGRPAGARKLLGTSSPRIPPTRPRSCWSKRRCCATPARPGSLQADGGRASSASRTTWISCTTSR
jgi:tetratricopeptide (TPR) repeat protein